MYPVVKLDKDVLNQITEADVQRWIVARLDQLRSSGVPFNSIELSASYRDGPEFYISWSGHAVGKCETSQDSTIHLLESLRKELYGDPADAAAKKRRDARELLREAEELDRLAKAPLEIAS